MASRLIVVLGACALLASCAADPQAVAAADSLLQADRDFAGDAGARGTRAAFDTVLARDGVIFRPEAVNGRKWLAANPDVSDPLGWEPDFVQVAGSADLGVTSGIWGAPAAPGGEWQPAGRYVTAWRRNGERWEVAVDHGVTLPPEQAQRRDAARRMPPAALPATLPASPAEATTVDLFLAFRLSQGAVIDELLDDQVEFLRDGQLLSGTSRAADAFAPLMSPDATTGCQGAVISRDATLSVTWGEAHVGEQRFAYLRVWRVQSGDGQLRLRLDLLTPLPPG